MKKSSAHGEGVTLLIALGGLAVGAGILVLFRRHVGAGTVLSAPGRLSAPPTAVVVLLVVVVVVAGVVAYLWHDLLPRRATRVLSKVVDGKVRLTWCWRRGKTWEMAWRIPIGATSTKVRASRQVFEEALNCGARFEFHGGLLRGYFGTAKLPRSLSWSTFDRDRPKAVESMLLPIPLGASRWGNMWADLTGGHYLVGGTTNFGKSVWLRQCLTSLVSRYSSERLRLVLVDLKSAVEFRVFENLPHLMGRVVSDVAGCTEQMAAVNVEIDRRLAMLDEYRVENIAALNARRKGEPLAYLVCVVDELAELRPGDTVDKEARSERQRAVALLMRVGRVGRAAGVHLIACTQRADADTVPGQLKAQLGSTVAFYTRDDVASRILLDSAAASDLPALPGRALYQHGAELAEVQVPYIELSEVEEIVGRLSAAHTLEVMREDAGDQHR